MEPIRCIIVDDEKAFINTLNVMIFTHPEFKIIGKARSAEEAVKQIRELKPQLVFLDVELGDGTGFDVLKRTESTEYSVIFVTAFDHYAVEAFRFSAIDYLLKPISTVNLNEALSRAENAIRNQNVNNQFKTLMDNLNHREKEKKKIVLKEIDTHHIVHLEEIISCVAEGSYTKFYLKGNRNILVSKHLKEYEKMLQPYHFIRVHRSYLINTDKIIRYDKSEGGILILEEGISATVSVRKREIIADLLREM